MKQTRKSLDIFSGLKRDTIRRNSQRSKSWLINKIKLAASNKILTRTVPKIGGLYLYVYDAKTKDTLPFWDAAPLVIPIQFAKDGFYGLNFHYLPPKERIVLLKILGGMQNKNYIRMSYQKLLSLSTTAWKFAFKRYLFNRMRSKFLFIQKDEWEEAMMLPVANFQKKNSRYVHNQFNKRRF